MEVTAGSKRAEPRLSQVRISLSPAGVVGLVLLLLVMLTATVGPSFVRLDPEDVDMSVRLAGPSAEHRLGTDQYGRDILSRLVHGARYTIWISLSSVLLSFVAGCFFGAVAGYFGGWRDHIIGRVMDVLLSFPSIFLGLAVVAAFGPGMNNVIVAVAMVGVPRFARITRGSVLAVKERAFVEASVACGGSSWRILFRHILPNCAGPVIVYATLWAATSVILASGLSYLGVGVQSPTPEWGAMLAEGKAFIISHPFLVVAPSIGITVFVLGLNLLGDGLRDYLDPHTRSGR